MATDRRDDRRALMDDEARNLVCVTASSDTTRFSMTGRERAALYTLGLQSGLRSSELSSLKVGSFCSKTSSVLVEAAYTKNGREDVLPLNAETAAELKRLFANKTPEAPAFAMPHKDKVTRMLRVDLKAAGVPYELDGKFADMHALRHTFVSKVVRSGATVKECQVLARHAKHELTVGVYPCRRPR